MKDILISILAIITFGANIFAISAEAPIITSAEVSEEIDQAVEDIHISDDMLEIDLLYDKMLYELDEEEIQ
ncbi:MAG: hypothetical protein BEN19_09045 [Epulopiscium sp. Nuni2H_MBin003]|nr:MAG: hypothetical protein BEN19_09045 [Epulopiscium sp. Nuni2H_MBin003]